MNYVDILLNFQILHLTYLLCNQYPPLHLEIATVNITGNPEPIQIKKN